jgi:D-glycero-D-manno-heptose 1,7-bisphosphate phosphatase
MGIHKIMNRAVFLDRDGVINCNMFNKTTGEWESPYYPEDFELFPWAIKSLRQLQDHNFFLFLVSNQPSYAKGKIPLGNIKAIQDKFHSILTENQVYFTEYFYCYHHPNGKLPHLSIACDCRKPGTLFLKKAEKKYKLDLRSCWMIGDRDSDIACGVKAGVKTILILNKKKTKDTYLSEPNFKAVNLAKAVDIITG